MSVLAAALALAAAGGAEPAVDWGARLRRDAELFRRAVLDSHPGPVDPENPGFRALLERAHARAVERARTATSRAHYEWALNELGAAFDDGHLGLHVPDGPEPRRHRWPGFSTRVADGRHLVALSDEPGVPVGAELIGCDRRDADALAAERVGRFHGRWMLRSQRETLGHMLFLSDNPWIPPLARCAFRVGSERREVTLTWRAADMGRLGPRIEAAFAPYKRHRAPIGMERLPDGSFWIGMGSFSGEPDSDAGRALATLNKEIAARAGELRRAPRVTFDLRGNNGGSSSWINGAAAAIWGEGAVAARGSSSAVDWRVSDANIAALRDYEKLFAGNPAILELVRSGVKGLEAARARGAALWREPEDAEPTPAAGTRHAVAARAFVLTDEGCASACLDAVDVLTAMGAVQVGRETSADTLYMEVRREPLPDTGFIHLPMKVYRGRPRGSNVPATPRHVWAGEMGDTAGLRRWIAGL